MSIVDSVNSDSVNSFSQIAELLAVTGGAVLIAGVGIPAMVSGGAVLLGINAGSKAVAAIAVVTGASATAFGASDAAEGAQYLYKFFSQKDIEPVNFIRDNVPLFQKYPWLYAGVEFVTTLSAGASLNILNAQKNAAALSGGENNAVSNTLTDAQKSRLNALDNTINDHLTENDFSGALRDLQGNPVPNGKGGYFDHVGEMQDSYRSLQKIKKALEGSLKNPNLSDVDKGLLQEGLDKANSYISRIENLFESYGGTK